MGQRLPEKYKEYLESFRESVDSENITFFLAGITVSIVLLASLSVSGLIQPENLPVLNSDELSAEEVGLRTEYMVNEGILFSSPNNVSAEYISAESAEDENLPGFYRVKLRVSNPTSSQITEVFAKKDASLVFLQFPREMNLEDFDQSRYH